MFSDNAREGKDYIDRDDGEVIVSVYEAIARSRGSITERLANKSGGRRVWAARFSFPDSELNHRDVVYLQGRTPSDANDALTFFKHREAAGAFALALEWGRPVAVLFDRLDDASAFFAFWKHD